MLPTRKGPGVGASARVAIANHTHDPIDLKLLLISAISDDTGLAAIHTFLDQIGIPHDIMIASQTPLVPSILWDGSSHGYYSGIFLTEGSLVYNNAGVWESAFTSDEWQTLWDYEAMFGVRQVTWYTMPDIYPDNYGLTLVSAVNTYDTPLQAQLTPEGREVFSYIEGSAVIPIYGAYVYLASIISPTLTTALVTSNGHALVSINHYADGRQNMTLTTSHHRNQLHSIVLSYGVINWVSRGLFLGEKHANLDVQVDDVLDDLFVWDTAALTNTAYTMPVYYRLSGSELDSVLTWQNNVRSTNPNATFFTLELAFNGIGAVPGVFPNDTLTPRVIQTQANFNWISHTYDHRLLDTINQSDALAELTNNDNVATQILGLTHYNRDSLVTPAITGLDNPDFLTAAVQYGIQYLVSYSEWAGWGNPSPNAGIYSSYQPSILIIPRHTMNLFYDTTTPTEWVSEYNYYYGPQGTRYPYWDHNLNYAEVLDKESTVWLRYLLTGDLDPLMFHQGNLRAYDGTHSTLGDLFDATLAKYNSLYNLPIRNLNMHDLGVLMASRMVYDLAGVRGTWTPCSSVSVTTQNPVVVPITGLAYGSNVEQYGGQSISYIQLAAGQTATLPALAPCQTIAFAALADKTIVDPAFTVNASASSGLPVNFTAAGSCTVAGALVSLSTLGSCTITAHQDGNINFEPAADVSQTFTVIKASQTINFAPLGDKTILNSPFAIHAVASSGLPVHYTATGACTVAGDTVSVTDLGMCSITAHQTGSDIFNAAPEVVRSFQVTKCGSTVALESSPPAPRVGIAVTITANVRAASSAQGAKASALPASSKGMNARASVATGTVTFTIDGANVATVPVGGDGTASFTTSGLTQGKHRIVAQYSGDALLFGSSSEPLLLAVSDMVFLPFVTKPK